ncbi:MAG: outer membrane beta-barrel protein [Candidatus Omnitrophica bacterium]|nr:outer membrane beta-barrel protein [Candidatus Omnitrophota bacterium]
MCTKPTNFLVKFCIIYALAILLVIYSSGIACAQLVDKDLPERRGLKIGNTNIMVHAALRTDAIYDDNIFLSNTNEQSDWITVLRPSVGIEIPHKDNMFSADYELQEFFYDDFDHEDHPDHRARGLWEINFTNFSIAFKDTYKRFTNRAAIEDSSRIRQQNNDFRASMTSEFDQLGLEIGYTNKLRDYISTKIITGSMRYNDKDHMSHVGDFQVRYRFLPKTSVIFEVDAGFIEYDEDLHPDSFFVDPLIGLKGELTSKITADLRAGYRFHDYESGSVVIKDDFEGFVARGGLKFRMTDNDLFSLNLERSTYESTYQNINHYVGNFIRLGYTHNFNNKLSADINSSYQFNRYPDETVEDGVRAKRRDDILNAGASIKYLVQEWITLQAGYEYRERDSKFNKFDYKDNLFTASATIGF